MIDVFISWAREDRAKAFALAETLTRAGLVVWWDHALLPEEDSDRLLDQYARDARAIIVCWSVRSVTSRWVRSDADIGLQEDKLYSVRFDRARPPAPYDRVRTIDLSGWTGEPDRQLTKLVSLLKAVARGARTARTRKRSRRRKWISIGAIASAFLVILGIVSNVGGLVSWFMDARADAEFADRVETIDRKIDGLAGRLQSSHTPVGDQARLREALRRLATSNLSSDEAVFALLEKGSLDEAVATLEARYREKEATLTQVEKVNLLHQIGAFTYERDPARALAIYKEILDISPADLDAHLCFGLLLVATDSPVAAATEFEYILTHAPEHSHIAVQAKRHLSVILTNAHEFGRAEILAREVIEEARRYGYPDLESQGTNALAKIKWLVGDSAATIALLEPMRQFQKSRKLDRDLARNLEMLGTIAVEAKDYARARALLSESEAIQESLGEVLDHAYILHSLGQLELADGHPRQAEDHVLKAIAIVREQNLDDEVSYFYILLAEVALQLEGQEAACAIIRNSERYHDPNYPFGPRTMARLERLGCGYAPVGLTVASASNPL